jgi:hypothetical protein
LIGIKDRKYLDATGLIRHRSIGDLMRYATMNQDTDPFARYLGKAPADAVPFGLVSLPKDPKKYSNGRYGDDQLYALALYLYSLRPPKNPNAFDKTAAAGQKIFEREGCDSCHTPPAVHKQQADVGARIHATSGTPGALRHRAIIRGHKSGPGS